MNREELLELLKPVQIQLDRAKEELNSLHLEVNKLEKIFLRVGKEPKEIDTVRGKKTIWIEEEINE